VLGSQLFAPKYLKEISPDYVYMAEDYGLCTHYKIHKHKIIFFLAAMRTHADRISEAGFNVCYQHFKKENDPYEKKLIKFCQENEVKKIVTFEIEDKPFEARIKKSLTQVDIDLEILPSPMFIATRQRFRQYLDSVKKPFMKTFYEQMRRETKLLMDNSNKPLGGKYSFDSENRKKLPKKVEIPADPPYVESKHEADVKKVVDKFFADHPGDCESYWLGTSRANGLKALQRFVQEKLSGFGTYQDALSDRNDFLFHSVISPYLNCGLITPDEVIAKVVHNVSQDDLGDHYNSIEGFVRQVLGWREFVRGIYQNFSEEQEQKNFFAHKRKLNSSWYKGNTGILPLDLAVRRADRTGYAHHIERLMVIGNMMVLCEIEPTEAHRWFMEMFIDSSEWVMGPNVYGMGIFSDGGMFATKPYICGANYIRKMSDYPKGDWEQEMTALYWRFVGKNMEYLSGNIRCKMITRIYEKFDSQKKKELNSIGDQVIRRITSD